MGTALTSRIVYKSIQRFAILAVGATSRSVAWIWHLLVRNRLSIAIASLVWLIFRSGSQPRRISYPCQQVAAVNVSAFAAALIPTLFLARRPRCPHAMARPAAIRRQFVIASLMFVVGMIGIEGYQFAGSLIPPQKPEGPPRLGTPAPTIVGIYKQAPAGASYTTAEIEAMVRQAIALAGGLNSLMVDKNNDGIIKVVIKPNLVQTKWGTAGYPIAGVVTDPRTCAAVVKVAKEAGAQQVIIAEGTADNDGRNCTWTAFKNAGYDAGPQDGKFDYDTSVNLFDLNDTGGTGVKDPNKVTLVSVPNGVIRTSYYVPNTLLNCDVLISVPTLKNHGQGTVTLSMKNHVGCAPNDIYHHPSYVYMKWALLHSTSSGFAATVAPTTGLGENEIVQRTVVDLNLARPHDFAVVEGLQGMTNGPNTSPPTFASPRMQMMVAGRDGLAVDTICTLCMRYDPDYIMQLTRADSTGALGTKDRRYITVLGNHVASVRSWSFPGGYAGSVLVETTPPTIPTNGISLTEGQQVSGLVNVCISGESDNVGVIKAELYIDGQYVATDINSPFCFDWDASFAAAGTHTAKVTVYDAAMNEASISRSVSVVPPEPIPGDFNGDRHVEQADLEHFEACQSGPGNPPSDGCQDADLDHDTDVDQSDFGLFQRCITGPTVFGDSHCED